MLGWAICACQPQDQPIDSNPLPPEPAPTTAPSAILGADWRVALYPLAATPRHRVAGHPEFGTFVGNPDGLFRLSMAGLESVHVGEDVALVEEGAVQAIVADEHYLWVGAEAGLLVYEGRIAPSPLNETLGGQPVRGLARYDGALWICTDEGLWAFEAERLSRVRSVEGCIGLTASESLLTLRRADGEPLLLRRQDGVLQGHDLAGPPNLRHVVSDVDGTLYALEGGRLKARVAVEGSWRWRGVVIEGEEPAHDVLALLPDDEGFWMLRPGQIGRWFGGELSTHALPETLAGSVTLQREAEGIVWVLGPEAMARVGGEPEAPPTFCDDIEPMYQTDCARCHHAGEDAGASDLSQFEHWRDQYDMIYALLRAQAMPKDTAGVLSGGSLYLLQRWHEGGMIACGN